jgi:hypothetical protein
VSHFNGKTTKEWSKTKYQEEIEEIKGKLINLNNRSGNDAERSYSL